VAASYTGDANDAASASNSFTQTVGSISTVTALGQSATSGATPQLILVASITGSNGPTPTGTVTFMNGTLTLGSATLDSSGVATLVPDLAPGTYNVIANYLGDADHSPSTSAALQISGTPLGFALALDPPTLSMAASQNATINVNITSDNGFSDVIGLGCGTLPAGVTCHFNTSNVSLKGGQSASVQLTIDTNLPLQGGSTAMNTGQRTGGLSLAGLFLPTGLLLGLVLWRFRRRHAALLGMMLVLLTSGALFLTGCSGFTQSMASPGTYTIQVTGVGSNSNITHYQNITLTITK
jgi:hypothetical protein